MQRTVGCVTCGREQLVPDGAERARCPQCGTSFHVPAVAPPAEMAQRGASARVYRPARKHAVIMLWLGVIACALVLIVIWWRSRGP